jgi:hypothetical protein
MYGDYLGVKKNVKEKDKKITQSKTRQTPLSFSPAVPLQTVLLLRPQTHSSTNPSRSLALSFLYSKQYPQPSSPS